MNKPLIAAMLSAWLTAYASTSPPPVSGPTPPPQWLGASDKASGPPALGLPHQGQVTDLSRWWQQLGDPLLVDLIDAGQSLSPDIATAWARMAQARATSTQAQAALLPSLDASASASRSKNQGQIQSSGAQGVAAGSGFTSFGSGDGSLSSSAQLGLQTRWEIDLFGGLAASRSAALARLQGAQALWHEARVSVAAEVASLYIQLRFCERLAAAQLTDSQSRQDTAQLTQLSTQAGFESPATLALARASAAQARSSLAARRAQCDLDAKALVALTGKSEPDLRAQLATPTALVQADSAVLARLSISALPATVLAQRPDIYNAERNVLAARGDLSAADARRYPSLTLSGSVGRSLFQSGGVQSTANTWSIGPLSLSLPLFDAGQSRANVDAATAQYLEAVSQYQARVRTAVRETEEALVQLQSLQSRQADAGLANQYYQQALAAAQLRYQNGLGSLLELEDIRRSGLQAAIEQLELQRDQLRAWVALYRAAGGGWDSSADLLLGARP